VAWFIGQSTIMIVLAFVLGLVVGWLLWARRMRLLTVEVAAARIRAAERATTRLPYGRTKAWTSSVPGRSVADSPEVDPEQRSDDVTGSAATRRIPAPRVERAEIADSGGWACAGDDGDFDDVYDLTVEGDLDDGYDSPFDDRPSTPEFRGLERLRDLFSPTGGTAGRSPRTPEPRHTEAETMPAGETDRDNGDDGGGGRPDITAGGSSDDTTLAAAGLGIVAGEDTATDATQTSPRRPDSDCPDRDALGVDDELALVEAVAAHAAVDDLTRIDGIGPKVAAALVAAGIRTYDQLATVEANAIAAALRASRIRLTSSLRAWPARARELADCDQNGFDDRGSCEDSKDGGGTSRRDTTTNTRTNGYRAADTDNAADVGGEPVVNGDHRPNERKVVNEPVNARLPKRRSPRSPALRSIPPDALDPDDLARIEGIGPKFAAALVASGIRTFGQLANAGEPALRKAIGNPRPNVAPSLPTWPMQARYLAAGDEDGFAELTARLIAGRRVDDNLERIDGIGPQISAALRAAGIHTFRKLADSDGARLRGAIESAGMRFAPRLTTWARQARLLADGDEEGFAELSRRLDPGRDEGRP
jgi:predicted flap endonuclease-1-like 5' DNA nuclease